MSGAYRDARGEVILGDIITHIDDKPIRRPGRLITAPWRPRSRGQDNHQDPPRGGRTVSYRQ